MTIYYVDLKDGNDSNDGTTFANRKKTLNACSSLSYDGNNDEIRVKTTGAPTLLDNNATIWNTLADGARSRYVGNTPTELWRNERCFCICCYCNHTSMETWGYSISPKRKGG